jgi:hypothetical protein
MKDRYTEHISQGLNVVEKDNPNLGVEGQHEHTIANPYGLHFHADGTLGGMHIHTDQNPLGVHSHGTNPVLTGGHYHTVQAAGNLPADGSHGHLDDDSPELKEKISPKPSFTEAKKSKSKLQFNEDGTIGLDNSKE